MSAYASISASTSKDPGRFFVAHKRDSAEVCVERVTWRHSSSEEKDYMVNEPSNRDFLHIPNDLIKDGSGLWSFHLKYPFRNITICIQHGDFVDEPLIMKSFPDPKRLSSWLTALSERLGDEEIHLYLVAIDKFHNANLSVDREHDTHKKVLPAWKPWRPKLSKIGSGEAKYSQEIIDYDFRNNLAVWEDELHNHIGRDKLKVILAELPLACECQGVLGKLQKRIYELSKDYTVLGGREQCVDFA
jgi:hypothetical protein